MVEFLQYATDVRRVVGENNLVSCLGQLECCFYSGDACAHNERGPDFLFLSHGFLLLNLSGYFNKLVIIEHCQWLGFVKRHARMIVESGLGLARDRPEEFGQLYVVGAGA